jgi:uncharacterized repeat protein (TIGR03803 family)
MRTLMHTLVPVGTVLAGFLIFNWDFAAQTPTPKFTTLYSFLGPVDGGNPKGLVFGKDGVLYGTTSSGGPANAGTVYSLTPPGGDGSRPRMFGWSRGFDVTIRTARPWGIEAYGVMTATARSEARNTEC